MGIFDRIATAEGAMQFIDRLARWWPLLIGTGAVGWLTGWAASAVGAFAVYSPLSWVLGALIGSLLFIFAYFLWATGVLRAAHAQIYRAAQQRPHDVNPLDASFDKKRIRLADFADPVTRHIKDKTFVECELVGPAVVAFANNSFDGWNGAFACDFVVVRDDKDQFPFQNVIVIEHCHFRSPKFLRMVLMFDKHSANELDRLSSGKIQWLTSGR